MKRYVSHLMRLLTHPRIRFLFDPTCTQCGGFATRIPSNFNLPSWPLDGEAQLICCKCQLYHNANRSETPRSRRGCSTTVFPRLLLAFS